MAAVRRQIYPETPKIVGVLLQKYESYLQPRCDDVFPVHDHSDSILSLPPPSVSLSAWACRPLSHHQGGALIKKSPRVCVERLNKPIKHF